jgi:hypothetical protein
MSKLRFERKKYLFLIVFLALGIICISFFFVNYPGEQYTLSPYPNGKAFAFTITDDPDSNTLEKIMPVYEYLYKAGLKTTIALWVYNASRTNGIPDKPIGHVPGWGDSCERPEYLDYMKTLQARGFEIASHGPSAGNDRREKTISGYETFREHFGSYPKMYINHQENLENMYWGKKVAPDPLSAWLLTKIMAKANIPFSGEEKSSEYYWGDILRENTKYVRLLGTPQINTLKVNPSMPYHDPDKPYVNYWFSFSDGNGIEGFARLLSRKNIDRLVGERGTSIIYTHVGFQGFISPSGSVSQEFKEAIDYIASREGGWFVPASEILDRLLLMKNVKLLIEDDYLMILNLNEFDIEGVTLLARPAEKLVNVDGVIYEANEDGAIIVENIGSKSGFILSRDGIENREANGTRAFKFRDAFVLINSSKSEIQHALRRYQHIEVSTCCGERIIFGNSGEAKDRDWFQEEKLCVVTNPDIFRPRNETPGFFETYKLFLHRALVYIRNR